MHCVFSHTTGHPTVNVKPEPCSFSILMTHSVLCAHGFSMSVLSCAQIERRMELVRVVSHNTHKRMVSCLQGHIGADAEKRHVRPLTCRNHNQTDLSFTLSRVNQLKPDRPSATAAGSPVLCCIFSSSTNLLS